MNINQMLQQTGAVDAISRQLGVDPATAEAGASALLPSILSGFQNPVAASEPASASSAFPSLGGGLGGLLGTIGGLGGAGLLENVTSNEPTQVDKGNQILGQLFGSKDGSRAIPAHRSRPRRIAEAHILLDQQPRKWPDVETGKLSAHHVPVDAYVARQLARCFDAERCTRVALQLLTPNALVRTADPERFLMEQPPDGHRVGPSIASQRGEYANQGLLQEPFEILRLHAGHASVWRTIHGPSRLRERTSLEFARP